MKDSTVTFLIGIFTGLILGASIAAAVMVQRYNGGFWIDCTVKTLTTELNKMCTEHKKNITFRP